MSLLEHRILVVTGKGGVGKSTVAAAIGLRAAAEGRRTLIVEPSGARRMAEVFGLNELGYEPVPVRPDLYACSITPEEAIEEYVVRQIRFRGLYRMVFRNRVMAPFVDAVPGLHEAIQLGKVTDLEQETRPDGQAAWDLVVVDAPATGHGLTMLASATSLMELTRAGPVFEGARRAHESIADPERTAIVLVALPEEMPVRETLDLYERLGDLRRQVALCALNEVLPPPLPHPEDWPVAREALLAADDPAVREAVALTDAWLARVERQDRSRARLRTLPVPVVDLPFLGHRDPAPDDLLELGRRLLRASAPAAPAREAAP